MCVGVTGASGLVGKALTEHLSARGDRVIRLVRGTRTPDRECVYWNPVTGEIELAGLAGVDAFVHLAGENIAAGRWSAKRKAAIRASRVAGTRLISESLAGLPTPPKVLVAASAIGYYGQRGDEWVDEDSTPGSGFLGETCVEWEAAAQAARDAGIRVVSLRIGIVLSRAGGALRKMRTPFRLGLGGVVGNGRQYMSWIALQDLVHVVDFALRCDRLAGPVNAVAPNPVTNREFTVALGRALKRPTVLPLPPTIVRLVFGEMGQALLLEGARVRPAALLARGFSFRFRRLEDALQTELSAREK